MKIFLLAGLFISSTLFASNNYLEGLHEIEDKTLKQNIWNVEGNSYDISEIEDKETKRFFLSLLVSKPAVAIVAANYLEAHVLKLHEEAIKRITNRSNEFSCLCKEGNLKC